VSLFTAPIHQTSTISVPHILAPELLEKEEHKIEPIEISTKALCNCYLYTQISTGGKLPRMADIAPNVTEPAVGDVAIMMYDTVKHVAVVTEVSTSTIKVKESNYHACQESKRTLAHNYRRLVGYYRP
jgi:hypothetical protein